MKSNNADNNFSSEEFKNDKNFWNNYLSDMGDHVKFYNINSNRYKNMKIQFENKKIANLLKKHGFSNFKFLIAVFSLYLSRIDKTKGVLFKFYIPSKDMNSVLKIDYDENSTFEEYLNNFNKSYCKMIEHTKESIDNFIQDIPLFYSIYDLRNSNSDILPNDNDALILNIYENTFELLYNCDLFQEVFIRNMLANIESIISNVLDSPKRLCKDIDIISDEEKSLISEFSKGKHIDFDRNRTFAMAFREHALNTPDKIAVDDGVNQVSYRALEKSSNSIAYDLHNRFDIGPNSFVALMLPRCYHYPELVLALNKIGATFIPIDVDYPVKRIEHMLNISQANQIITTKEYDLNRDFTSDIIYIEDLSFFDDVDFELNGSGNDLFSIIFTSGTTGLPKGVMISNKQLSGTAVAFTNIFESFDSDLVGVFPSFSFVGSFRLFWALYNGDTVRIFNEDERMDKFKLIEIVKNNHFHDLMLPAAVGLDYLGIENIQVDYLVCGSAKLDNLPQNKSNTKLINLYGSTELFSVANICDLDKNDISIGKSMANTWSYVLDENNMQLPIGVAGEICVSADYLSFGYYKNAEKTNKVFVDNPYSDCEENKRMYRTGDIGYYNFDGKLEIIGRNDDQLSVRGFRVESSEILNISKTFDSISDVCLDVDNDKIIFYYVACDELDIGEVENAIKKELPYYMIPSMFIELDEIPLNRNGKVDKAKLPKIPPGTGNTETQNATEQELLEICWDILGNEDFGVYDRLSSFGISSLQIMDLNYKIYSKFNVNLEYSNLAQCQNVREIYELMIGNNCNVFKKYEKREVYPLTQNQIFSCEVREKNPNNFKMYFNVKITDVDVLKLKDSFIRLMDRHPFLKSTIIKNNGKYSLKREDNADVSYLFKIYKKNKKDFKIFEKELLNIDSDLIETYLNPGISTYGNKFFYCVMVECEKSVFVSFLFDHLFFDYYSLFLLYNELDKIYSNQEYKILEEVIDGFDYNLFFVDKEKESSHQFEEFKKDVMDYGDLFIPWDNEYENSLCQRDNLMYIFDDKHIIQKFCNKFNIRYNHFFIATFALTLYKFSGLKKGILPMVSNGRFFNEIKYTQAYIAKTIYLKFETEKWNVLNDVFDSISREMKRIIKTEPNTFNLYYGNQWLFNFLEVGDYDFNLDIIDYNLKTDRPRLIKNIGENILNDVVLFETSQSYVVYMIYLNKFYNEETIMKFLDCWNCIIKHIISKNDLNMSLDFYH